MHGKALERCTDTSSKIIERKVMYIYVKAAGT